MRLVNFSVTNFRSITAAHRIPISQTTVLVGRNNEGKSNVLKALSVAMTALQEHALDERERYYVSRPRRKDEAAYYWIRDFPISLQCRPKSSPSRFRLEFVLDDAEVEDFKRQIGSKLNGTLPLEIKFGKNNKPDIKVSKKGPGSATLNTKSAKIAKFVAERIVFNYIPAVRTDQEAMTVIGDMLAQELRVLEKNEDYQRALDVIGHLQKPILEALAIKIKEPLSEFLPTIKDVSIEIKENTRRWALRSDFNVVVDDGTPTSIEYKGDGVKSLAALGLLKNRYIESGVSIIAIEEPESHLHPAAIHQLNEVIESLSAESQVIVTTHNPLFVDRKDIKSNVIINGGKAIPAKNISSIRDLLGIKASDNLTNANFALVVEGDEDRRALGELLPFLSITIGKALRANFMVIEAIGGAGNLSYKVSQLKNALCTCHILVDYDEAGRRAFERAEKDGILTLKECTMTRCNGMDAAELEDCYEPNIYKAAVLERFGVDLKCKEFRGNKKWSDRVKQAFVSQAKPWDEKIERQVKAVIASIVAENPSVALSVHKRNAVDSLVASLERLLEKLA